MGKEVVDLFDELNSSFPSADGLHGHFSRSGEVVVVHQRASLSIPLENSFIPQLRTSPISAINEKPPVAAAWRGDLGNGATRAPDLAQLGSFGPMADATNARCRGPRVNRTTTL